MGFLRLSFPQRRGTKAYTMEGHIGDDLKSERLSEILNLQEEITYKKNYALEGTIQEILIEGPSETDPSMLTGRTKTNKIVTISDKGEKTGSYVLVRIEQGTPTFPFGSKCGSG